MSEQKVDSLRDLATRTDMFKIDPRIIEIESGHNPRNYDLPENHAHLEELKTSIIADGVKMPVSIRLEKPTGKVILVDGECRVRATLEAIAEGHDIKTIPAIVVPGGNEKDRLFTALIANTGKPLSTWEAGTAFQRLISYGETEESISKRLGYSLRYVKEALELADAPEAVKQMVSARDVTPSLALHELRTKAAPEAIESLRQKAKAAKANGKAIARKEHSGPSAKTMMSLIQKLVESVEDELFEDDGTRFVEVDKNVVRRLAGFVGIKEKVKA